MTQLLPDAFIEYIHRYPALTGLSESLLQMPVTSVRLNPLKSHDLPSSLTPLISGSVPWCESGYYLRERPQFTFDPGIHQGVFYVQDASSMAIGAVIKEIAGESPVMYLDACAAPGGKTTCAVATLPAGSIVVANEYDHRRASILYENIAKWGATDIVVSRGDTSKLSRLGPLFDIVAVDAPCSGEGMMRKDVQAVDQWSPHLVDNCASLQREIITNVLTTIKPGGYLIYSTCTFNTKENEENVEWMIREFGLIPVTIENLGSISEIEKGIDCSFPCYRFIPGKIEGEGLFISVLKKPGDSKQASTFNPQSKKIDKSGCKNISEWVLPDTELWNVDNEIWAASSHNANLIRNISSQLDTLAHGVHVATVKGKDIIPTHELALSKILNKEAFAKVDISIDDAIHFLQKDNISLPSDTPRGYVLLMCSSIPLGFVKNIGNRSNNLLPKQWRILSRR